MGDVGLGLLLSAWVFFLYGSVCIVSTIFTFSLETYFKIDKKLNLIVIDLPLFVTILDRIYIDTVDIWMLRNNKIIGPFLIILSLIDMQSGFDIINKLTFS